MDQRSELKSHIRKRMYARIEQGLFPHNGQWLPREEVEKNLKKDRKAGRTRAIELLSLYFLFSFASLLLMAVVFFLAY